MPRGGKRPGAGRKVGAKSKFRAESAAIVAAEGIMPLDYMLKVMRDKHEKGGIRLEAAKSAAPYVHKKKPQDIDVTTNQLPAVVQIITPLSVLREKGNAKG